VKGTVTVMMSSGCLMAAAAVCTSASANRTLLKLASTARLPTIHELGRWPEAGAFMSYGPDLQDLFVELRATSTESSKAQSRPSFRWNSRLGLWRKQGRQFHLIPCGSSMAIHFSRPRTG
jgi:hypothetical protein